MKLPNATKKLAYVVVGGPNRRMPTTQKTETAEWASANAVRRR
jgi:hypothetical protein